MPISKPHSTLGANNKESCAKLALYLEKENKDLDKLSEQAENLDERRNIESRKQFFFNHLENKISTNDVIDKIDRNKKKLSKTDAKYFAPTINFSQQELKHILETVTSKKDINDIWELTVKEHQKFNLLLQEFTLIVMNNYAKNFNRENRGLKSGEDLVYFAKIEHFRKFKGIDKEVIQGVKKSGELKPGINSHVHIIVSRKDRTQKMKLMPIVKERNTTRIIGNNKYQVGFDRMKWINMNEKSFDSFFKYKRPELEKFNNQYILKNGTPKEKRELILRIKRIEQESKKTTSNAKNYTNNTSKGRSW